MWVKISSIILRYRVIIGIILVVVTGLMGFLATKTEMAYELTKVIPDDDPANIVYEKFKETFGEDGSVMVVGVQSDDLFKLDFFRDWYIFTEQIDSIQNVEKLISITKLYDLRKNDSLYKFQVVPLVTHIPTTQAEVDSIKEKIDQLPFYKGYLYNEETNATFIAVTMDDYGVNSHRRVEIVETIEKYGAALSAKHHVDLHYSGVPYIRTVNTRKISKELALFTFLSVVITGLFLLIFFRSLQIVLTSLILVIVSLIYTIGSMYLLGFKIGILTALIPPLIVVIAIQNCVYLLNVYHFEYKAHGNKMLALSRTISKIGLASFLTNATTAIGFGVFSFTGSSLLDEFGRLASLNIMVVYVLCIILIPIIYSFLPGPSSKQLRHLDRRSLSGVLDFVKRIVFNHRKWVYGVTLVIVGISLVGALQVRTFGYILDGISPKDKLYKDLKFFEKHFDGLFPFEIWIDTKEPGNVKDLATLTKIETLCKQLRQYDELSKPLAVTEMLKFMNQAYYNGNPRRYLLPNPLDMGRILSYLPQETDKRNAELISSMIDSNYQITRVSMKISDVGTIRNEQITKAVEDKIDSIFPKDQYDVHVTGKSVITVKGNGYLIHNALTSLGYAFIIICVLMGLLFSSYKMISIALLPNLIPLFMTLGIMGFTGISLKESTILIFSVAFGIVVDLTIHYLAKYRLELKRFNRNISKAVNASIEHSGFSMIYSTVILFFGFIIFAFSSFEGTIYLGILTSMCLAFGLLSNLFLLPSLLLGMEKRINTKKAMSDSLINLEEEEEL
ncbi:MAG: MMPL family transporter [Bacteroidetes bacterium]|nr:MMPL family transporter [Bacteroidota bacterium]